MSYDVSFDAVAPVSPVESGVVFGWDSVGASLVTVRPVRGEAPGVVEPQTGGEADISLVGSTGEFEIQIRLPGGFSGNFAAGISLRGTAITFPPGSVLGVSTNVVAATAPASPTAIAAAQASVTLPGTGFAPPGQSRSPWGLVLSFAAAAAVCVVGGFLARGAMRG